MTAPGRRLARRGACLDGLWAWLKAPLAGKAASRRNRLWARYQRLLRAAEVAEAEAELWVLRHAGEGVALPKARRHRLIERRRRAKAGLAALIAACRELPVLGGEVPAGSHLWGRRAGQKGTG